MEDENAVALECNYGRYRVSPRFYFLENILEKGYKSVQLRETFGSSALDILNVTSI